MKFENTAVFNFEGALRGMRNPMNSWSKSDSYWDFPEYPDRFVIGENDMELAQKLIRAGSEHRKFLRQIFVSVDITAPLYWWKEFDTYKVGTVANSTSTMHKLSSTPITVQCFEIDDYDSAIVVDKPNSNFKNLSDPALLSELINNFIAILESLRLKYIETKDNKYWKELIRWLPSSWLQTRTVTLTYENLYAICRQRKGHKLNEWSGRDKPHLPNFINWVRSLPYADELIFLDKEI